MNNDVTLAARAADAGRRVFDLICQALADQRGVHLETAVAAAGAVAGAEMLRSCGIDLSKLPPAQYVLVDKVNELGPMLLDALVDLLRQNGVDAAAHVEVPADHQPHLGHHELNVMLLPAVEQVMSELEIPPEMRAFVAARAAAQLILAGREACDPLITKAIFVDAAVRGSKTVPPAV